MGDGVSMKAMPRVSARLLVVAMLAVSGCSGLGVDSHVVDSPSECPTTHSGLPAGYLTRSDGRYECLTDPLLAGLTNEQAAETIRGMAGDLGVGPVTVADVIQLRSRVAQMDELIAGGASCDDLQKWLQDHYASVPEVIDHEGLRLLSLGQDGWGDTETGAKQLRCNIRIRRSHDCDLEVESHSHDHLCPPS
jgi:hypothetical protein